LVDIHLYSCLGHRNDLDGEGKEERRSEKLTDHLYHCLPGDEIWSEWGAVVDVLVWKNHTSMIFNFIMTNIFV
jgi:hypothetical protein